MKACASLLSALGWKLHLSSCVAQFFIPCGPLRYSRVRVLAKAARSALAARDLSRLKGILANVLAERPRLYDNTSGHTSSGTTRSRLASAGSDASLDALAAIAKGQASTRANRNILHSSFQGQQVSIQIHKLPLSLVTEHVCQAHYLK